jgi:predicted alpha/beta superfamily hydrolase
MNLKILSLFLIICISAVFAQSNHKVKFIVTSENVPEQSTIYITGNHPLIGNWDPGKVSLTNKENNIWEREFSLPKDFHLEYKFTLGSWEQEALNKEGLLPVNSILEVLADTTIFFDVNSWGDQFNRVVDGQITGTVKYHHKLEGEGIRERDVAVWLPPGYDEHPDKLYPVLYMHDGQNMFDPQTSAFGVDWQIDEAADSLIRKGFIKPLIIVGIYNTPDRWSEYNQGSVGDAYMNFIVNRLKPLIDNTYRTLTGREYTAVGGSSMGGLISFVLLWVHSDVFSQAACISPAFKIRGIDFVFPVNKYTGKKNEIRIYIDNGSVGLEDSLQAGIDEMLSALKDKGYSEGEDLYYYKAPGAKHFESDWAERIWRPLIFMFGNKNSFQYIQEK